MSAPSATSRRVSGAEARALVDRGALLVDVRTPSEFATDGIKGAVNIPHDQVETRTAELGAKDRPIVLYCHSGRRSGIAARSLTRLGYSAVYDLGPRTAW
jgi:rhodanese-related sulfurtransferase